MKVFLLAALFVASQVASLPGNCSTPFLKELSKAQVKVKIFKEPKQETSGPCLPEWNTHGTCCDTTSLNDLFAKEKLAMASAIDATAKTVGQIKILVEEVLKKATGGSFNSHRRKRSSKEDDQMLKDISEDFLSHDLLTHFNESSTFCWSKLMELRGSSLCSVCSGRASRFIYKDKALINIEDCKVVVDLCEEFFANFQDFIGKSKDMLSQIDKKFKFGNETKYLQSFIKDLSKARFSSELISEFSKYSEAKSKTPERNQCAARICNQIFDIRKSPIIATIADRIVPSYNRILTDGRRGQTAFSTVVVNQNRRWQSQGAINNWRTAVPTNRVSLVLRWVSWNDGRRLTSTSDNLNTTSSKCLNTADTKAVLVENDNIYDAEVTAKGSPLQIGTQAAPMNLSLIFP